MILLLVKILKRTVKKLKQVLRWQSCYIYF